MEGWREGVSYKAIHVGASAESVPAALLNQLAPGGRMVLPVGGVGEAQVLRVIDRDTQGQLMEKDVLGVQVSGTGRKSQDIFETVLPASSGDGQRQNGMVKERWSK